MRVFNSHLRLKEFEEIRLACLTDKPWLNTLVQIVLTLVEDQLYDTVIAARVKEEVSKAIEEYHEEVDKVEPMVAPPVYSERFTEASSSLPEMSLRAPWYHPPE